MTAPLYLVYSDLTALYKSVFFYVYVMFYNVDSYRAGLSALLSFLYAAIVLLLVCVEW